MITRLSALRARVAFGVLALLLALAVPGLAAAPAHPPVKLVVILAVDGLSWPRLDGYRSWLDGGLQRLLQEGQVETSCHFAHLNTETGPGHASLGTGAPPRVHGVVANRWFEMNPYGQGMRRLYCTDQPDPTRVPGQPPLYYREIERDSRIYVFARRLQVELWEESGEVGNQMTTAIGAGPEGKTLVFDSDDARVLYNLRRGLPPPETIPSGNIPGPANLRIATLADRLVEASPSSRVVSLSGKDRGAIFLAGKNPEHVVYWYDRDAGRYVTSAAYNAYSVVGNAARDLVRLFNRWRTGGVLVTRFGTLWKPLPEPQDANARRRPEANLERFQSPDLGLGFDHDLALDPRGYFNAFYGSPFQDQLLTDLALDFLADPNLALGRRGVPDVLALSYSAHDVVSHGFGNESAEELDTLRRLDRELGRLLAALDELAKAEPAGQVVLALSSDHGFSPLPEVVRRRELLRYTGGRLAGSEELEAFYPSFQERLNRALSAELCMPFGIKPLYGSEGWTVAYNRPEFPVESVEGPCGPAGRTITLEDLDRVFAPVVQRLFGEEIERVLLVSQKDRWPEDDPAVPFARNDFDAARSGDAFLVPRRYVLMHWDPIRGSGHGSHHDYDTHVPCIFWGGPFRAAEKSGPSTPYDLAPTLADVLGIRLPEATGVSRLPAAPK